MSRERAAQSKLLDLETQLSRNKTELNQLRRNKDDVSDLQGMLLLWLVVSWQQLESINQGPVDVLRKSHGAVSECDVLSMADG